MATLTYDPTPADQPEFTEAEQDSLARGEALAAEEQQLLAGKFRDAEELEKAYMELQSKLGSRNNQQEESSEPEEATESEETTDTTFFDTLWQESQGGEFSDSTLEELSKMDAADIADEYLRYRSQVENNQPEQQDISNEQVASIHNVAGGSDAYQQMIEWASANLAPEEIEMYDSVVSSGNFNAINFAVLALKARYTEAVGIEGELLKGRPAPASKDVFRSQAEVVAAMADPRYDKDPAYRNDVFAKLERSNIQY
jgi:hypothetical protein